jgi:hypothetical protein
MVAIVPRTSSSWSLIRPRVGTTNKDKKGTSAISSRVTISGLEKWSLTFHSHGCATSLPNVVVFQKRQDLPNNYFDSWVR